MAINGIAERAVIDFIIRDFETQKLALYEKLLKEIAEAVLQKYPAAHMSFQVQEQYRNMKEVLVHHPLISSYAWMAYKRAGLTIKSEPIRGGTDGSRLSFMGLPCPNIFTGMQAIHSKHEWIAVQDMQKAVEVLVHLAMIWEENSETK